MPKKPKKSASTKSAPKADAPKASELSEPTEVIEPSEAAAADPDATMPFSVALRWRPDAQLADIDPRSTPGFTGDKKAGQVLLAESAPEIGELQERLYAQARGGSKARLLLVVQGMDTSGKGGIMRHVVGLMDPQGVDITAFKAPNAVERNHPFLWRIRQALPKPARSGSSTARSTRTCSSSACTISCRPRRGRVATARSTPSRPRAPRRASR